MNKRPTIFEGKKQIRPYQYPQLIDFPNSIFNSFWSPNHFTYEKDKRDFEMVITPAQRVILERTFLAIASVENVVKSFWGKIGDRMPFTEISDVGYVFSCNEVIHRLSYERILLETNLETRFNTLYDDVPQMEDRRKYLTKYLKGVNSRSDKEFTKSLILFTLLIENASLFSQFLIASSFDYHGNVMKNFGTIVTATTKEEDLHSQFGAELINIIREEFPEWFDADMEAKIRRNVRKAYKAELGILDWIFEESELEWISKKEVIEYLKSRFNNGLGLIGYEPEYEIDESLLKKSAYMELNLVTTKNFDQFDRKGVDYTIGRSFEEDDIFDDDLF